MIEHRTQKSLYDPIDGPRLQRGQLGFCCRKHENGPTGLEITQEEAIRVALIESRYLFSLASSHGKMVPKSYPEALLHTVTIGPQPQAISAH